MTAQESKSGGHIVLPRMRNVPPQYIDAIRMMAQAIKDWTIAHPEAPPRFAVPRTGVIVGIKYVWPVICQNPAARELVETFQDIGRVVGGAGLDPTVTQLAIAIRAVGLPVEVRPAEQFVACAYRLGSPPVRAI